MADDLYTVLGVNKGARDDEIRRAYRRLAKELHPDMRPDDPGAGERFKKVTAAYDQALVDPYVHVTVGVRDATGRWLGNTKPAGLTNSVLFLLLTFAATNSGMINAMPASHAPGDFIIFSSMSRVQSWH